jgi:hypothetical protein
MCLDWHKETQKTAGYNADRLLIQGVKVVTLLLPQGHLQVQRRVYHCVWRLHS